MRIPLLSLDGTTLCRPEGSACIACCRGRAIPEPTLLARLRRQTRRLPRGSRYPGRLRLLWHELTARWGLDLLLGIAFLLPGIGPLIRRAVHARMCCAFLGFPEEDESRPGCLLHPSLWGGVDRRRAVAFRLLPGFGCKEPGYLCPSAVLERVAPVAKRLAFQWRTRDMGWYGYSAEVEGLEEELLVSKM